MSPSFRLAEDVWVKISSPWAGTLGHSGRCFDKLSTGCDPSLQGRGDPWLQDAATWAYISSGKYSQLSIERGPMLVQSASGSTGDTHVSPSPSASSAYRDVAMSSDPSGETL